MDVRSNRNQKEGFQKRLTRKKSDDDCKEKQKLAISDDNLKETSRIYNWNRTEKDTERRRWWWWCFRTWFFGELNVCAVTLIDVFIVEFWYLWKRFAILLLWILCTNERSWLYFVLWFVSLVCNDLREASTWERNLEKNVRVERWDGFDIEEPEKGYLTTLIYCWSVSSWSRTGDFH